MLSFQTHLICTVPPYANPDITDPVTVQLFVTSSNKKSESHSFVYTPKNSQSILMSATSMGTIQNNSLASNQGIYYKIYSKNILTEIKKKKKKIIDDDKKNVFVKKENNGIERVNKF